MSFFSKAVKYIFTKNDNPELTQAEEKPEEELKQIEKRKQGDAKKLEERKQNAKQFSEERSKKTKEQYRKRHEELARWQLKNREMLKQRDEKKLEKLEKEKFVENLFKKYQDHLISSFELLVNKMTRCTFIQYEACSEFIPLENYRAQLNKIVEEGNLELLKKEQLWKDKFNLVQQLFMEEEKLIFFFELSFPEYNCTDKLEDKLEKLKSKENYCNMYQIVISKLIENDILEIKEVLKEIKNKLDR